MLSVLVRFDVSQLDLFEREEITDSELMGCGFMIYSLREGEQNGYPAN